MGWIVWFIALGLLACGDAQPPIRRTTAANKTTSVKEKADLPPTDYRGRYVGTLEIVDDQCPVGIEPYALLPVEERTWVLASADRVAYTVEIESYANASAKVDTTALRGHAEAQTDCGSVRLRFELRRHDDGGVMGPLFATFADPTGRCVQGGLSACVVEARISLWPAK